MLDSIFYREVKHRVVMNQAVEPDAYAAIRDRLFSDQDIYSISLQSAGS